MRDITNDLLMLEEYWKRELTRIQEEKKRLDRKREDLTQVVRALKALAIAVSVTARRVSAVAEPEREGAER